MAAREREYDDDEDRPRPKRRPSDEFEEDRPRPKRRPSDEYEEGEPPPRRRPRDEYEEEEDDRPRRRARDDYDDEDDYEERPRRKKRRRRDVDEEYAGFFQRFAAVFIDAILLNIVLLPLRFIIPGTGFADPNPNMGMVGVVFVINVLVIWLYEAGMISSSWQATLGKKALRIKVTDLDGRPIGFAQATGRYFAKWISGIICGIGYFMQPFTERKQALHDMIAGTLVVRDEG
jgi:uncharacterized RDD family membrane protein YckC